MGFAAKLYERRYMLKVLALRELKARFAGSAFGVAWAVLQPLVQLAVYGVVFGLFFRSRPAGDYGTDNFFLFLLCGLVPWHFFAQSLSSSAGVLRSHRTLIKRAAGFPSEMLPIVTVLSNLIGHLIGLVLVLGAVWAFHGRIALQAPAVLVYLLLMSMLCVGLGWVFSSVNVYLRDVQQAVGLLVMGWFFLTPVFYSPELIPEGLQPLMRLNPMYHVVDGYRLALLSGRTLPAAGLLFLAGASLLSLFLGGMVFKRLRRGFPEFI